MFEREIDGHALRCEITLKPDGTYRIMVHSRLVGSPDDEVAWEIPIHPPIRSREAAERHARYIMAGIESMHGKTGPKYTVV